MRIWNSDEIDDFLNACGGDYFITYGSKKAYYYNVPCSFDIETTSFMQNGEKQATMYIWMLGINGCTMIGRTWDEFLKVIRKIVDRFELNDKKRMIFYVHNLAFEFQFIRKWFTWSNVFAISERTPVYAVTDDGIEFRCSYILSGYSLETVGKNLRTYKVDKLVGDLDYSLWRNSLTNMTDKELCYCINDIRVVMAYIQERIDKDGDIRRIQLTKTGYVRKYCRDSCMYDGSHKKSTWKALNYQRMMSDLTIDVDEYEMLKRAFQGGFTHANAYHSMEEIKNVHSYDFTSSYPSVMVAEKYPMSEGERVEIHNINEFKYNLIHYCCVFEIRFYGITAKENANEHPLSRSKCRCSGKCYEDNGRIIFGEDVETCITNVDFDILKSYYTWESMSVGRLIRYRRGYLPSDFIKAILKLYEDKTTLKGVADKEDEYMHGKEMLNSCYGMIVTDIVRESNTYDGEWKKERGDVEKSIHEYNVSRKRFLFYPWGVFVTAYARRNLFSAIYSLGDDYIYSDTDSVKFVNIDRHKRFFDDYNKMVVAKLEKVMSYHRMPVESIKPKTVKGVEKPLGVFDYEGMYSRFKTLGAKRYMTEKDGSLSITVSGVNKRYAVPYLLKMYKDPFKAFEDDLKIPADYTGKMTHTYIDDVQDGYMTDYQGHTAHYHELSSVHLEKCEYSLSLSDAYLDLLMGFKERSK